MIEKDIVVKKLENKQEVHFIKNHRRNEVYHFTLEYSQPDFVINNLNNFMYPNMRDSWVVDSLEEALEFFTKFNMVLNTGIEVVIK